MSAVARPPIRILGLCGFSQNKHVMHQRLGFLRKALKQQVEFGKLGFKQYGSKCFAV